MKKFKLFMAIVSAAMIFAGCQKEGTKLYDISVNVHYPQGYTTADMLGIKITVVNNLTSRKDTTMTNAEGWAILQVEPGSYTVSASVTTDEFALNGIIENVSVAPSGIFDFHVSLEATSLKGGLVFKEIYYTGSKTPALTSYYADQFHEIYNNSDQVIYLDGLCLGCLEPSGTSANVWIRSNGALMDSLPVTFHTWMFPGTGQQYPLAPRTSIVVAQDGIDHKTDPAGNPSSPVNLASAQWETYVQTSGKDTDTPGVPNLTCIYTTSTTMFDWLSSVFGAAIIIFRLPTGTDYNAFVNNPANFRAKPGSTGTTKYLMVNKAWVIDAVEEVQADPTKQYKRLHTSLDAGKIWCSGTYVSKSIRRKVSKVISGKVIYKDTNNSAEDFVSDQTPTPFVHPAVVDAK